MKRKNFNKNLVLNKQTIVKLTNKSMGYIIGGEDTDTNHNEWATSDDGPITKTDTDDPVKNEQTGDHVIDEI